MRMLLALLLLHVVTSARYGAIGDASWAASWWLINPDLLLILTGGCLLTLRFGYRRLLAHACVLFLFWIPLYRIPLVVNQSYFRSEPFFFDNLEFVFGTWILLANHESNFTQILILIGIAVGVVLAWSGLYLCVRTVMRGAEQRRFTLGVVAFAQLFAVMIWAETSARPNEDSRFAGPSMLAPLAREMLHLLNPEGFGRRASTAKARVTDAPQRMTGLGGADVYVLFVESYGRLLFEHPQHRGSFEQLCGQWDRTLRGKGFASVTTWMRSPCFGGKSQAAHATLLAGMDIGSYGELRALEQSDVTTLPRLLATAGYETVNAQPKLDRDWPASTGFYGFTRDLFGKDLPYLEQGGFRYPWAPAPDQYCLRYLLQNVVRGSAKPLFVHFVSATSHVPFSAIPPYHEDWQRAEDAKSFLPVTTFPNLTELSYATAPNKDEAFLAAMVYSLRTSFGFAAELSRPSLVLILGDHQPARLCEIEGREPTWDVPLHVVTNRPELLAPLRKRGYGAGLVPKAGESLPMREFLVQFLRDYGK